MRRLFLYLFCTGACLINSLAQNEKHDFKFNIGALYRITPIYLEGVKDVTIPRHKVFIEQDRQLMSGGITLGLVWVINNDAVCFQYSQILRYGYIDTGPLADLSTVGVKDTRYGLMTDFQFLICKNFNVSNKNKVAVSLGYSLLNRGTSYTYVERNNSVSFSSYTDNLNFSAFNLSLGYVIKDKLKFELMNYFTNHTNFNDPGKLLLLELRASCFF
jgi:hypothetical protein